MTGTARETFVTTSDGVRLWAIADGDGPLTILLSKGAPAAATTWHRSPCSSRTKTAVSFGGSNAAPSALAGMQTDRSRLCSAYRMWRQCARRMAALGGSLPVTRGAPICR